jgi:hypothetical protein
MAWFKFGKSSETAALSDAPVETAENLRSRAKRRLIGALVLVLTAVIGFPLLFDTQPRPVLVDEPQLCLRLPSPHPPRRWMKKQACKPRKRLCPLGQ